MSASGNLVLLRTENGPGVFVVSKNKIEEVESLRCLETKQVCFFHNDHREFPTHALLDYSGVVTVLNRIWDKDEQIFGFNVIKYETSDVMFKHILAFEDRDNYGALVTSPTCFIYSSNFKFILALDYDGKIWVITYNDFGFFSKVKMELSHNVDELCAVHGNCLYYINDGTVYEYALFHKDFSKFEKSSDLSTKVSSDEIYVHKFDVTWDYTAFLTSNSELYVKMDGELLENVNIHENTTISQNCCTYEVGDFRQPLLVIEDGEVAICFTAGEKRKVKYYCDDKIVKIIIINRTILAVDVNNQVHYLPLCRTKPHNNSIQKFEKLLYLSKPVEVGGGEKRFKAKRAL